MSARGPRYFMVGCVVVVVLGVAAASGCGRNKPAPRIAPPSFPPLEEEGQIPEKVLRDAAARHGGAMAPQLGGVTAQTASGQTAAVGSGGLAVVLGPIAAETEAEAMRDDADAGSSIREVIAQGLTANREVTLVDAPEERFVDDSPRPDLARQGIRYVVKGVVSRSGSSGQVTVFLRAVETSNGEVAMVASGRSAKVHEAAGEAVGRLLKKLDEGS